MKESTGAVRLAAATLLILPLALSLQTGAHADNAGTQLSGQAGVGLLTSSDARDTTNSSGLHLGLEAQLGNKSLLSPVSGKPSLDVDFNNNTGKGGHIETYGIDYAERIFLPGAGVSASVGGPRPYVGLGVGAYHTDVRATSTTTTTTTGSSGSPGTTTTTSTSESKSGWQLGGKLLAGLDFGRTYLEASYQFSGSRESVRTDTVNLALGVHF